MKTRMLSGALTKGVLAAGVALSLAVCAGAQPASEGSSAAESAGRGGIPIMQLIATVSKISGKKFIVDPRVRADVSLVGINPSSVNYAQLLEILHVYGFAAAEQGGLVVVVPDAAARTLASPLLTERETRLDAEIVTDTLPVRNTSAARLVPILRPLLQRTSHLAAVTCNNTLVIVDTFATVKRIEALVRRLDVGEPFKPRPCDGAADRSESE